MHKVRENDGRRQLLQILATTTRAEVARRLGYCRSIVGHWAAGEKTPGYWARRALERLYGIPMDAWDQPVVAQPCDAPAPSRARAKYLHVRSSPASKPFASAAA